LSCLATDVDDVGEVRETEARPGLGPNQEELRQAQGGGAVDARHGVEHGDEVAAAEADGVEDGRGEALALQRIGQFAHAHEGELGVASRRAGGLPEGEHPCGPAAAAAAGLLPVDGEPAVEVLHHARGRESAEVEVDPFEILQAVRVGGGDGEADRPVIREAADRPRRRENRVAALVGRDVANPTKYLVPPSRDGAPRSRGPASEPARRVASSRVSAAVMVAVEVMVSLAGGEWGGVC
jgi:hypothetical protein